jgi:hypothetical protein
MTDGEGYPTNLIEFEKRFGTDDACRVHYFLPVIEEIFANPPSAEYLAYLKSSQGASCNAAARSSSNS